MMTTYDTAYIAQVSMGANKQQLVTALTEAEAYDGPALIIAYSTCIAHGFNMRKSMQEQKLAVDSGFWQLYRFNPALKAEGKNPFILDSKAPTASLREFFEGENRFATLKKSYPAQAEELFALAERETQNRRKLYERLAQAYELS